MNTEILECGHVESPHSDFTRGYGTDSDGKRYCYECCAKRDIADMLETGRACLYLSEKANSYEVTNWPGSLRFSVDYIKTGRHNLAGKRYDAWFTGPKGTRWWGIKYGENTQIIHCRKIAA